MNDFLYMILAFASGLLLGTMFFGGLWLTIRKAVGSAIPALWFFVSFIFRTGITLIGFYYVSSGNWQRLLICLFGFVTARYFVLRITKLYDAKQTKLKKQMNYET